MNKWVGIGRLTKDPDFRENEVNENSSFCRFTIAVDRPYVKDRENQPTADFINCVCFGKSAAFINKWFHKGEPIAVEGRIQTGSYTNKEGNRVNTTDIMVEKAEFVPKTGNSGGDQSRSGQGGSGRGARDASERRRDDFADIPDGVNEELPFN